MAESCYASYGDPPWEHDCQLPAGHDGQHSVTITWDESPPAPYAGEISPGWEAFLISKYGRGEGRGLGR